MKKPSERIRHEESVESRGRRGPPGKDGRDGLSGTRTFTGTEAPSESANGGDLYVHVTTGDIYKYTSSGWVLSGNIRGPAGQNGSDGSIGPKGDKGDRGDVGETGPQGIPGPSTIAQARVTANRTTTANTYANVTDLSFSIAANETWTFEAYLRCGCSGTGGSQYSVNVPTGATLMAMVQGSAALATTMNSGIISASDGNGPTVCNANAQDRWGFIAGTVVNGATPGTVQVRFRSVTAGQTTTVNANSFIWARRH